jgi:hypothetical protein
LVFASDFIGLFCPSLVPIGDADLNGVKLGRYDWQLVIEKSGWVLLLNRHYRKPHLWREPRSLQSALFQVHNKELLWRAYFIECTTKRKCTMREKHTVQKKTHDAQKNTHGKLSAHDKVFPLPHPK